MVSCGNFRIDGLGCDCPVKLGHGTGKHSVSGSDVGSGKNIHDLAVGKVPK
jgi:hypothetical protein